MVDLSIAVLNYQRVMIYNYPLVDRDGSNCYFSICSEIIQSTLLCENQNMREVRYIYFIPLYTLWIPVVMYSSIYNNI